MEYNIKHRLNCKYRLLHSVSTVIKEKM